MYLMALSRIVFSSRRQGEESASTEKGNVSALLITHVYR